MSVKNGGPAFPVNELDQTTEKVWLQYMGITMRDYFAAKELTNMHGNIAVCDIPSAYERIADHCYRMADAMIAAREMK